MEEIEYRQMDAIESSHWWFVAKRQFLADTLVRFKKTAPGLTSLDVGCGTGAIMQMLKQKGFRTKGLDMSDLAISYCNKKGLSPTKGDATSLPFEDNSIDVVTALDVVEHVKDDKKAVEEMYRVLKPGGIAVITVPAHMWLWSYHDVSLHHHRRYSGGALRSLLSRVGPVAFFSPIHMAILPIVTAVRGIKKIVSKSKEHESDVRETGKLVSTGMGMIYAVERLVLRLFGKLPFGTSYLAVIKKP